MRLQPLILIALHHLYELFALFLGLIREQIVLELFEYAPEQFVHLFPVRRAPQPILRHLLASLRFVFVVQFDHERVADLHHLPHIQPQFLIISRDLRV